MKKNKNSSFFKYVEPTKVLLFGYFTYIVFGWFLLSIPFSGKTAVSFLDHLFTCVSAVSTTGLTTVSVIDSYSLMGQIIIIILIQLGGIGYMTFGSFIILSIKQEVPDVRKNILSTSFSLPKHFSISKFIKSIIIYSVIIELIGAILLYFIFRTDNRVNAVWSSVFHSVSSFCTAGFSLYNNSLEGFVGNFWCNIIIGSLSIFGAIGYIVMVDIWLLIKGKKNDITLTSKIIINITLWTILTGTLLIFITEPSIRNLVPWKKLQVSFFQAMTSITTVGFNTIPIPQIALSTMFLINIMMIIGASPSGTGGGIKSTTLSALLGLLNSTFKKEKNVKLFNRIIPQERIIYAVCSFSFYIIVLTIGVFLLTLTEKIDFHQILFEASSALGTVGLSTGITNVLTPIGKLIIIILMYIGRLGPISFGIALFFRMNNKNNKDDIVI